MSQDSPPEYYLAIVASGISTAGWLGVVIFGLYATSLAVSGDSPYLPAMGVLVCVGIGAAFALIEKSLYRRD